MLDHESSTPAYQVSFRRPVPSWRDSRAMSLRLIPLSLTGCLVAWTVFVCPYTDQDSIWAALMALAFLPAVVVAHLALVAVDHKRAETVLFGILHVPMFAWVLLFCLLLIGKAI